MATTGMLLPYAPTLHVIGLTLGPILPQQAELDRTNRLGQGKDCKVPRCVSSPRQSSLQRERTSVS